MDRGRCCASIAATSKTSPRRRLHVPRATDPLRPNGERRPGDEADPRDPGSRSRECVEEPLAAEAGVLRWGNHFVSPVAEAKQMQLPGEGVRDESARRVEHL